MSLYHMLSAEKGNRTEYLYDLMWFLNLKLGLILPKFAIYYPQCVICDTVSLCVFAVRCAALAHALCSTLCLMTIRHEAGQRHKGKRLRENIVTRVHQVH